MKIYLISNVPPVYVKSALKRTLIQEHQAIQDST